MQPRWYGIGAALAVSAFAGCVDLSQPSDNVFSLSEVQLPSPGVVVNDTMRDSTGQVAPLHVTAFNAKGDSIDATVTYVVLDTGAHAAGALLIGDTVWSGVRVIGSTAALQTLPVSFAVTLSPDTIVAADSTLHHVTYSLITGDTTATSADLTTLVQHVSLDTTAVDAVIVHYAITQAPPAGVNGPEFVLMNGPTSSDRDTTSAGLAARTLRLRIAAVTSASDTAVVSATAAYRGHTIGTVQFTVVFTSQ